MKKETKKYPGKKVLVVDDYFINQEVTQDILELMEFEVEIAENGVEALKKHEKNNYDLILMDIQMPELDGYGATKAIRKREAGKCHTPIIALTANAMSGDQEKCLEAGMDGYISKPIEVEQLGEIIKKHLQE